MFWNVWNQMKWKTIFYSWVLIFDWRKYFSFDFFKNRKMSEKIVFKTISNKVLFKTKYNNFLLNNVDQSLVIDKIMDFCRKYYIFCVENLDDYEHGQIKKDRIIRISFIRFLCFLTAIRFFISSLSSKRWVIIFMSESLGFYWETEWTWYRVLFLEPFSNE